MKLPREVVFRRLTVLLATMMVAGCASNTGTTTTVSTSSAHHEAVTGHADATGSPMLSVRMIVPPTVVSGSSVTARLVIDNRTARAIPVTDCAGELYQVLLENQSHHQGPEWLQCATTDSIPLGVSIRTIPVQARAGGCVAGKPTIPGFVPCTSDGKAPALPPGTYHAHVFAVSPQLPTAPDVTVQVLPARQHG